MRGHWGSVGWVLAAGAAVLSACDPWRCDFESHGACVEFEDPAVDVSAAKPRMDRLLELELPFWGLASLDGWRIQLRTSSSYVCYTSTRNDGCTDYFEHTLSVKVPPSSRGCFEAAELLHELGHYTLGDPMHSNDRWKDVEAAFAPMVWDRPDAAPECVGRYHGIREGVWPVHIDGF